ncbi:MAG TPA: hypothetical protein VFA78_05645, partial [Chloroflexota bacterium]|nr:hypothetical protein [Chloroflexota bacterium]
MTVQHLVNPHFHGSPRQPVVVPDPVSTFMPGLQRQHYAFFWATLLVGIGALIALSIAAVDSHSGRLEVLFVFLGSLFVPALYVYYMDMRNMFVEPRWRTIVITFVLGAFLSAP